MGDTVFMVAEKPLLAESISKILSHGSATKKKGFNNACNIHEWNGQFQGRQARFKMTSTCGHVMTTDFPPKYNNWEKTDPVELFTVKTIKIEASPKMKMQAYLASVAQHCTQVVLWLDCDKEGENICFEVLDAISSSMRLDMRNYSNVWRAHFSAINERDIREAMAKLIKPNLNQARSVDARQELDLRIGCAFTRFQTKYFHGKYGDLDSNLISYGPCQTPTLGFCTQRHDEIQSFRSEPYWVLDVTFNDAKDDTLNLRMNWCRGRMFERDVAQLFLNRVQRAGIGRVEDVKMKEGQREKPIALNTVELMRACSSGLHIGPATAMAIAERLYTQGYISYPRTETTAYAANTDHKSTLRALNKGTGKEAEIAAGLIEKITPPRKGEDKGDHPPITPQRDGGGLSGDDARVFDYIVQHYLATLMTNCKYTRTTVRVECGGEYFETSTKVITDKGFTRAMCWLGSDDQDDDDAQLSASSLASLSAGLKLQVKNARLAERQTSPPDYLTEAELITLMEKHSIGTDASIPTHINNIQQRNYVQVTQGRRLVPTPLGVQLAHAYWTVDPDLVTPTMRAQVEKQLNLIAEGRAEHTTVTQHTLDVFRAKFIYFVQNMNAVDVLFETVFTSLARAGKPFSRLVLSFVGCGKCSYCRCGKCRRYMKLIEARPQRIHCPQCGDTYPLPAHRDMQAHVLSDQHCPLDNYEIVHVTLPPVGANLPPVSLTLCPYCYSNPPFESMRTGEACENCLAATCKYSMINLGVTRCSVEIVNEQTTTTCTGVLVLDLQSGPKWRLQCSRCRACVMLCKGAVRVRVLVNKPRCNECGARPMKCVYKDEASSPLRVDGAPVIERAGCIFCDKVFEKHVDLSRLCAPKQHGGRRGQPTSARGKGRGRGRGR